MVNQSFYFNDFSLVCINFGVEKNVKTRGP